jgi:large subunit ribosomal protein L29
MMKISKINEMSSPDLEKEIGELKTELFKLRFSLATHGLDNPMKIKDVKKDIARIKTVLRQRELEESKNNIHKKRRKTINGRKKSS